MSKKILHVFVYSTLAAACVIAVGCKMEQATEERATPKKVDQQSFHEGTVLIGLPEEAVAVMERDKIMLKVQPPPTSFQFQWQRNGVPLEGQNHATLEFKARLRDAGIYRCMIYRTKRFPETNFTDEVTIGVTERKILMALTPTLTAGTLVGGTYQYCKSVCWTNHQGYARFKSPVSSSYWWSPKSGATTCTIRDASTGAPTPNRRIDVMESGTLKHFCDTNPAGQVTFPITNTHKYQFIVYVINTNIPPDSAGETITLNVDGLQ